MGTAMPEARTLVMILVEASWEDQRGIMQSTRARMEDKSAGGACIRFKVPFATGARLKIEWRFDRFWGVVKYCRSDGREYLVGVQRERSQSALLHQPKEDSSEQVGIRKDATSARVEAIESQARASTARS